VTSTLNYPAVDVSGLGREVDADFDEFAVADSVLSIEA
jgi:hypothetical protein